MKLLCIYGWSMSLLPSRVKTGDISLRTITSSSSEGVRAQRIAMSLESPKPSSEPDCFVELQDDSNLIEKLHRRGRGRRPVYWIVSFVPKTQTLFPSVKVSGDNPHSVSSRYALPRHAIGSTLVDSDGYSFVWTQILVVIIPITIVVPWPTIRTETSRPIRGTSFFSHCYPKLPFVWIPCSRTVQSRPK